LPHPVAAAAAGVLLQAIRAAAANSIKNPSKTIIMGMLRKGLMESFTSMKNSGIQGEITVKALINEQVYRENKRTLNKYINDFTITVFAKGNYPNGKKVSRIVMYQNRGTRRHIARPFLKDIMREKTPIWRKELILANIKSKSRANLIAAYIGVAKRMKASIVNKIDTNTYPLNYKGLRPLIDTGRMRKSFEYKVTTGDRNLSIAQLLAFQEILIKQARAAAGTKRLSSL